MELEVLASVYAIPSEPIPEQIKVQSEPLEEIIAVEQKTWKCPDCTPNEKSCSSSTTGVYKNL